MMGYWFIFSLNYQLIIISQASNNPFHEGKPSKGIFSIENTKSLEIQSKERLISAWCKFLPSLSSPEPQVVGKASDTGIFFYPSAIIHLKFTVVNLNDSYFKGSSLKVKW